MSSNNPNNPLQHLPTFGIELAHSRSEVIDTPPDVNARQTIAELEAGGDMVAIEAITEAVAEVEKVVIITRENETDTLGLIDLFTAPQIGVMRDRIHEYLGKDIDSHLESVPTPVGYPFYVGRLATHFALSDNGVTSNFGAFERRHTEPSARAYGPTETNSREYARLASWSIIKQFSSFYQADFDVTLTGYVKDIGDGHEAWERGIAECQFLVLDYIRDLLAAGHTNNYASIRPETMTINDLKSNINNLITNQRTLVRSLKLLNPLLAEALGSEISTIAEFTLPVMHRGKLGVPRYEKEPDAARIIMGRIETLLVNAASLAEVREDQEEIPVLDI